MLQEWTKQRSTQLGLAVSSMLKGYTTTAATITATLLKSVSKFAVQVCVSLVLSFMFVWDLPAITSGIASLRSSRLAPVHQEVAPVLGVFGRLFGKALEAQVRRRLLEPECGHCCLTHCSLAIAAAVQDSDTVAQTLHCCWETGMC